MSHVASLAVEVLSLPALRKAARRLGGTFVEGQTTHQYYGRQNGRCHHAITFPGCRYEVGVVKADDRESYTLAWDSYEQALLQVMGGYDGGALLQAYGLEASIEAMEQDGATLLGERTMTDGTVELEFAGL